MDHMIWSIYTEIMKIIIDTLYIDMKKEQNFIALNEYSHMCPFYWNLTHVQSLVGPKRFLRQYSLG